MDSQATATQDALQAIRHARERTYSVIGDDLFECNLRRALRTYVLFNQRIPQSSSQFVPLTYFRISIVFEAFPIIFIERHNLSISQNGLIFLSLAIGATLGALLNQLLLNHYPHYMTYYRGYPPPEKRLYGAMIAGPSLVVGSLWLGWSGQYESVPWYVPALSGVLIGAGIILIFVSFLVRSFAPYPSWETRKSVLTSSFHQSYLIDTYMMYAASAFAANTIIRSAVGAAFPLFTVQMYHKVRDTSLPSPSCSSSSVLNRTVCFVARHQLGIHPHRRYRPPTRPDSVSVLQVRSEDQAGESICALYGTICSFPF